MAVDPLLLRARTLWRSLATAPVSFGDTPGTSPDASISGTESPPVWADAGNLRVIVAPGSLLCPPGRVGIVVLGDAAIVTAPDERTAAAVRHALAGLAIRDLTRPDAVNAALPVVRMLGPAALAYVDGDRFRPVAADAPAVVELAAEHTDLRALEQLSGPQDTAEVGLDEITSPAFAVREGGAVVAAAGYRLWPERTAHISILTAPDRRGRGLARTTGSAAVAHALAAGLLPQWRARVPASRRVALALGFRELGVQFSFELAAEGRPGPVATC